MLNNNDQLPVAVVEALRRGDTIQAIRILRIEKGIGLKEAHDAIERERNHPRPIGASKAPAYSSRTVASTLQQGNNSEAIRLLREHSGMGLKQAKDTLETAQHNEYMVDPDLSPGKVTSSGGFGWLIAAVIIGATAWFFIRGSF